MAKARATVPTLAEQLRAIIDQSGMTNYQLGAAAGVDEAVIWRFRRGDRDLRLETAGRICAALGVEPLRVGRSRPRPARPDAPAANE